jgi:hypothetical protein
MIVSVIIIQNVIVPAIVDYQHGLFMSPDFTISPSKIQGLGLFTKRPRKKGERLFVAINADEKVTPIGSKINHCPGKDSDGIVPPHSIIPNTYLSKSKDKTTGEWWIIAANDIEAGEELTMDYTYTPDFIVKPNPNWRCPPQL